GGGGSRDGDRHALDRALCADVSAAAQAQRQVGLPEVFHLQARGAGKADPAERLAGKRDFDVALPGAPVAVEYEMRAAQHDMGDEFGRSPHDDVAAVAATPAYGRRHTDLDRVVA